MKILLAVLAALSVSPVFVSADDQFSERDARYRIQPSDVIEVQYRYTPEYNHTVTIQPDGFAALQFVGGDSTTAQQPVIAKDKGVGRNDPCPCGSGKKFKQCHGKLG